MTKAHWWNKQPNFGDVLSPFLLRHFGGLEIEWAPPADAEIVGCGSLIDALPDGWTGTVAGSGVLRSTTHKDLTKATILGLRGHMSWLHVDSLIDPMCLADPALLVVDLLPTQRKRPPCLGIMSHWTDTSDALIKQSSLIASNTFPGEQHVILIDARTDDPMRTLREIASCTQIITSSLHGVICADALAIPRMAMPFPTMNSIAEGGEFKWKDYGASIGQPIHFGEWQTPDPLRIMRLQEDLVRMFRSLGEIHS